MKKRFFPLFLALLVLCLMPLAAQAEPENSLTLSQTDAVLFTSRSLTLRLNQAEGFREAVTWQSSNPEVATVNRGGTVRAVSTGSAVITASVPSGVSASCHVTVEVGARSVAIQSPGNTLFVGLPGMQLSAAVAPEETTNKSVSWTSSNPAIATVDEGGLVTPVSAGTVRITATAKSGAKRQTTLYVRIPTTGISLDQTELTAFVGRTARLKAAVEPANAYNKRLTWASSDPTVATVNGSGSVMGRREGTVVISATTAQGQVAQCVVHVQVAARSVALTAPTNTLFVGMGGVQLTAAVAPENTTDKAITWTSSNPAIATVDSNGYVTPVALGTVRVTATAKSGAKRQTTIHVRIPATSVVLNHAALTAFAGRSVRIPATVGPANAHDKRLTWTSSDPTVATVNNSGTVMGRKAGTVVITATTSAGVSAQCVVTVEVGARSLTLTAPERAVYLGEGGLQLTAVVGPEDTTNKTVTWTSSRPGVATVNEQGVVQAVSAGTTVITAATTNGVKRSITLRSYLPPVSVALNHETLAVPIRRTGRLLADVQPANAFNRRVTWISSDPTVATVNQSGTITGRKVGSCRIIARDVRGHEASCVVYVEVPVASIALGAKSITVVRGGTFKPQVAVAPADATNKSLTYVSANPGVAAVGTDGTISGILAGTTTVTVSSANGKTAAMSVRVVDPAESISVSQTSLSLSSGQSVMLAADVQPATAGDRSVSWSVSDPTVAVVTPEGKVIGHKAGTCVVTARANGGLNLTASCLVSVTGNPTKIVALTFDGTMSDNSQRVLDVLNRYGVKATFFLVGNDASYTYKNVLLQMVASGMEIGNHTHTHPHFDRVSLDFVLEDIRICDEIVEDIIGKRPATLRAPYGRSTAAVFAAEKRPFFSWNVDSLDWKTQNANSIYNKVMSEVGHMDVVLMHQTMISTAQALERMLPKLIEEGYDFVTASELYDMVNGVPAYPNSYHFLAVR